MRRQDNGHLDNKVANLHGCSCKRTHPVLVQPHHVDLLFLGAPIFSFPHQSYVKEIPVKGTPARCSRLCVCHVPPSSRIPVDFTCCAHKDVIIQRGWFFFRVLPRLLNYVVLHQCLRCSRPAFILSDDALALPLIPSSQTHLPHHLLLPHKDACNASFVRETI